MSGYLLDTNIVIAAMKGVLTVRKRLDVTPLTDLILSTIVLGELKLGVAKSARRESNAEKLALVVKGLTLLPVDGNTVAYYADIRASLESQGTPIGSNDYWIAAQALEADAILVTDNVREFQRVQGLRLENWIVR